MTVELAVDGVDALAFLEGNTFCMCIFLMYFTVYCAGLEKNNDFEKLIKIRFFIVLFI